MRRQIAITAFALALALPLWAQHGGGHAGGAHGGGFSGHAGFGGGHGGGFSGGHVGGGHFSGGHFSGGMRSSPRVSRGFSRSPSFSRPSARRGFSNSHFRQNRFRGPRIRTFGFRNNCFGFGCRGFGYPWAYGAYYDPWWWWDSGSSYDDDYERDRSIANDMNEQSLEQQRMLRQQEADGDQGAYGSGPSVPDELPTRQPIALAPAQGSRLPLSRLPPFWCSAISTSRKSATTPSSARPSGALRLSIPKRFRFPVSICRQPRKPTTNAA